MKSSAMLDSAVFRLTPSRIRCDLVISANGKTEKIASGLLNPFLLHLKAARDQMAKGGNSLMLEPEPGSASWFTKATVERFVPFVSTPEVLERVYTLESDIMKIEKAIAGQSDHNMGLQIMEGHQSTSVDVVEAVKSAVDDNEAKAIVLYKDMGQPNSHLPEAIRSTRQEGNSKDACRKFIELWKRKQENDGRLDVHSTEIQGRIYSDLDPFEDKVRRRPASPHRPCSRAKTA